MMPPRVKDGLSNGLLKREERRIVTVVELEKNFTARAQCPLTSEHFSLSGFSQGLKFLRFAADGCELSDTEILCPYTSKCL